MSTRPLKPATDEPAQDVQVGGYRIVGKPTRREGGSLLFEARSARGEPVALQLSAEPVTGRRSRARFRRLARARAGLSHPGLLPVLEVGDHGGRPFVVSAPVPSRSLADLLRDGPLAADVAVQWLAATAEGLDAANDAGLVHLTLGPESLLLERSALLLDLFGIFSVTGQAGWGDVVRRDPHLRYEPPEAVRGEELDRRSNVYSMAAILVHAITGREPYPEPDPMLIEYAHVSQPPPRPSARDPRLPKAFDELIARAMAKNPAERPASAGALLAETARVLEVRPIGAPVVAPAPVEPTTAPRPRRSRRRPLPRRRRPARPGRKRRPIRHGRVRCSTRGWRRTPPPPSRSRRRHRARRLSLRRPWASQWSTSRRSAPGCARTCRCWRRSSWGSRSARCSACPRPSRSRPGRHRRPTCAWRTGSTRCACASATSSPRRRRPRSRQPWLSDSPGRTPRRARGSSSPELQTATQDLASAYTALAAAAEDGDADAFAEAAEDVEAGERELAAAEIAPDGR